MQNLKLPTVIEKTAKYAKYLEKLRDPPNLLARAVNKLMKLYDNIVNGSLSVRHINLTNTILRVISRRLMSSMGFLRIKLNIRFCILVEREM